MFYALKLIGLILSLGIDTLVVSTSLGVLRIQGKYRIGLTFASAEALMPLVGFGIGSLAGSWVGDWGSLVGGLLLTGVAVWLLFFEDDDDDDIGTGTGELRGMALLFAALGVSLDELAVGFSVGMMGVPVVLTIVLIAVQAFGFSMLGLTYGHKLKPYLGEWANELAGVVLGLLGLWMVGEAATALYLTHHPH